MNEAAAVLAELESLGSEQNRKVYRRHGVLGPQFGVSYAHQDRLAKRLGTDQPLARALWASGNHDARVLAVKVADPARCDRALLDAWVADLDSYVLCDALATLAARAPGAVAAHERWRDGPGEWIGRTGWLIVGHLAALDGDGPDDPWFASRLPLVEAEVHGRENRVRDAMVLALIGIGTRSDELAALAAAAGRRIGHVEVDHGETGCKTPDMGPYLHKARAYRKGKQEKAAAKAAEKAAKAAARAKARAQG